MHLGQSVSISVAFPQTSGKGLLPALPHTKLQFPLTSVKDAETNIAVPSERALRK